MPISDRDLATIRERAAAATPGPWHWGPEHPEFSDVLGEADFVVSGETPLMQFEPDRNGAADAEFVAYARQDIPALLDALEETRGLVASLVACADRLDPSERHSVMRASENGCGWCGGDHLAELSALVTRPKSIDGGQA